MVFEFVPSNQEQILSFNLDASVQFVRHIAAGGGDDSRGLFERFLELLFRAIFDLQIRRFEDYVPILQ